jgi:hypothetical protein
MSETKAGKILRRLNKVEEGSLGFSVDGIKDVDTSISAKGKNSLDALANQMAKEASSLLKSVFFTMLLDSTEADKGKMIQSKLNLKFKLRHDKDTVKVTVSE